ncbi:MAG: hypothetical protein IKP50_02740 [Bacilli bacterium]|nr:hypothetical protein [Bacilli bacterium]
MRKRGLFLIPILASLLAGCGKIDIINLSFDSGKDITQTFKKGALGDFSLVAPGDGVVVGETPTFSWTESENAMSYTLEVCSSTSFDNTSSSIVYICETNIKSTSFKVTGTLKEKNIDYYWRVTSVNEYNSKSVGKEKLSEVRSFHLKVEGNGEIPVPIGDVEDWQLHKVGSYADISIDHSDFFGTGDQDSLKISFEKENTSVGPVTSIGWLDVQKAIEVEFIGADAFYCNFYFMGHDSTILIRIIDQDGELWYKQVKFTMDARQVVLLRFDEFILRTRDTVVQNEVFNYEHIQAIEVCFEKTFGDGCCIIGGMKGVKAEDYSDIFIKKLDFSVIPENKWINESYNFKKTLIKDDLENPEFATGVTLEYSTVAGFNGNEKGINSYGYGFAKIPVEKYFSDGNAVRVKIKYTGGASSINAVIRLYEPDKDRWSVEQPLTTLVQNEFTEITVPYQAFGQSSIVEGKRQFYFISQIQFGLNGCYSSGSLSFKDFEIIQLPSVSTNPRIVQDDGIIEDFDSYIYRSQAYEQWETSYDNKDEGIFLEDEAKFHNATNVHAGKFTYKADMSMATYDIYTDVKAEGFNSIKFWIKDASIPNSTDPLFADYKGEDVSPSVVIQVAFKDGRWYRYEIEKAPRVWTEYVIPFKNLKIYQGNPNDTTPLESKNVVNFAIGMQYFYYVEVAGEKVAHPLYVQNNPVYFDNIMLANATDTSILQIEKELHPDENGITLLDDFEYSSQDELDIHWLGLNNLEYENSTLSDEVSSEGGEHSVKLDYKKGRDEHYNVFASPAYACYPTVGDDVECRAIQLDIKGDGEANFIINLYTKNGTTTHQYRFLIPNVSNKWTRYIIGFGDDNWSRLTTGAPSLGKRSMQTLQRLTFGLSKNANTAAVSSVYVDNIKFSLDDSYDTYSSTLIPVE